MRNLLRILFAVTLLGGSAAAWFLPGIEPARANVSGVAASGVVRRQAIAFYEQRLREDPHSALDMTSLAARWLDEGRVTGDERAFVAAESLARKSLGERTRRNSGSAALLVNALLAQHRFTEATLAARELVAVDSVTPAYRALLAECLLEVGGYDQAIRQLGKIRAHRTDLGLAPRFARWAELNGRTVEARRILRAAQGEAIQRPDLTAEQRAWFSVRLADFELRYGNVRGATEAIDAGRRETPDDSRLILMQARLEAARGTWRQAAELAERVVAESPSPDAFVLLASANEAIGRHDDAAGYAAALEGIATRPSGQAHRTWVLALLDRGDHALRFVTTAAADTLVRRDIHTLDLLAWALYRSGRSPEALPLARRAVVRGTTEPLLRYHAGLIELAAGDRTRAREHLKLAMRGRRALSDAQVAEIRKALRS